ncbi:MAG: response regulator [Sphingomicrobium sp.]
MRILIVEDEALVAMEIEGMLGLAGHEAVAHADDLQSALNAVEAGTPDLALVDIHLGRGNSGLDVAAALKERGVPVLFATGNCPMERGRDLALGCLHKPFTDNMLLNAIRAAEAKLGGQPVQAQSSALHFY